MLRFCISSLNFLIQYIINNIKCHAFFFNHADILHLSPYVLILYIGLVLCIQTQDIPLRGFKSNWTLTLRACFYKPSNAKN